MVRIIRYPRVIMWKYIYKIISRPNDVVALKTCIRHRINALISSHTWHFGTHTRYMYIKLPNNCLLHPNISKILKIAIFFGGLLFLQKWHTFDLFWGQSYNERRQKTTASTETRCWESFEQKFEQNYLHSSLFQWTPLDSELLTTNCV